MSKWDKPVGLTNLDVGFGPSDMKTVLPAWEEIPDDFKREVGEGKYWSQLVNDMFFRGVEAKVVVMKEGVDKSVAMRHLRCVLRSFDPSHEHKIAGAAFLASKWFEKFDYVKVKK